jgi:hypothetical protein
MLARQAGQELFYNWAPRSALGLHTGGNEHMLVDRQTNE